MKIFIKGYSYINHEGQKITIPGGEQDSDVTSIILDKTLDNNARICHCMNCGKVLFQYVGNIVQVIPGGVPSPIPILVKCPNCEHRYLVEKILEKDLSS